MSARVPADRAAGTDVVVVGGGPAGLSAALWLGRYDRSVRVYDAGTGRNQPAGGVHGYPGLRDPTPAQLRSELRGQAGEAGATIVTDNVARVEGEKGRFLLTTDSDEQIACARIVLAYGLRDYIPAIPGFEEHYGRAVFHCPDCDGPTVRGRSVGVLGWDRPAAALALFLLNWTQDVTLLAHGCRIEIDDRGLDTLSSAGIAIRPEPVERAVGSGGALGGVRLEGGDRVELSAIFFHLGYEPRCELANTLGCALDEQGAIIVDRGQETSVQGVYAAGDITGPPHLAIAAAAEGVRAALTAHRSLLPQHLHL